MEQSSKTLMSDHNKVSFVLKNFSDLESGSPTLKEPKKLKVNALHTTIFELSDQFEFTSSCPKIPKSGSVIAFFYDSGVLFIEIKVFRSSYVSFQFEAITCGKSNFLKL